MADKKRKPRTVESDGSDQSVHEEIDRSDESEGEETDGSVQSEGEEELSVRNKKPLLRENRPKGNVRDFDNATMQSTITMGPNRDLDPNKPPMTNIESIIDNMVQRLGSPDFKPVFGDVPFGSLAKLLEGRALKIVTMCSGTEAPILALGMFREALAVHEGIDFNFWHVASAEITPFKQAYIQRNFEGTTIFADVTDFSDPENQKTRLASTAFGGMQKWPEDFHILVAGSSCVDFSNLNKNRTDEVDLEGAGKSESTLAGVLAFCDLSRPGMIILENVKGCPWEKFEDALKNIGYDCKVVLVDTKNYGLPQTRERGYMVCFDRERAASIGFDTARARDLWTNIMTQLQCRATSPFTDFVFSEEDEYLQKFREPAYIAQTVNPSTKQVAWEACRARYKDYRKKHALGTLRPITHWSEDGTCRYPDYTWTHWAETQRPRVHDSIDIHYLNSARDKSKQYDTRYKHRCVELSQNIDRDEDTRPMGIVGCITPTGLPYLTSRGGPMDGREALALQGLPLNSMSLPVERTRHLQDFAGNAMSTPVVGAAAYAGILSVFHQYASASSQTGEETTLAPMFFEKFPDEAQHLEKMGALPAALSEAELIEKSGDWALEKVEIKTKARNDDDVAAAFKILNLGSTAGRYCLCEGFRHTSKYPIKLCKDCGETACDSCADNPPHNYGRTLTPIMNDTVRANASRLAAAVFDQLPNRLEFSKVCSTFQWNLPDGFDGTEQVTAYWRAVERAFSGEFHLQYIRRGGVLRALYKSENAELELSLVRARDDCLKGHAWHLLSSFTLQWHLYAKPGASEAAGSIVTKTLREPLARMDAIDGLTQGQWQFRDPKPVNISLKISANSNDLAKSWRNTLGLQDDHFRTEMRYRSLKVSFSREALRKQPAISVLEGTYLLRENCGTAENSLYVQKMEDPTEGERLYLMVDPDPIGNGPDSMVFVYDPRRLTRDERRVCVARLQYDWRPIESSKWKKELQSFRQSDSIEQEAYDTESIVTQNVECKFSGGWIVNDEIELSSCPPDKHGWVAKTGPITIGNDHKHDEGSTLALLDIPSEAVNILWPEGVQTQVAVRDKPTALENLRWLTTSAVRIEDPTEYEDMVHVREPRGTDTECYLFRSNGRSITGTYEAGQGWFDITLTGLTAICQRCYPKLPDFEWENRKVAKSRAVIVAPKYKADTANLFEKNLRQVPNAITATVHRMESTNTLQFSLNLTPPVMSMLSRLIGHKRQLEETVHAKWRIAKITNIAPPVTLANISLASNKDDPSTLQLTTSAFQRPLWASQKRALLWMIEKEGRDDEWKEVEREEIEVPALGLRVDLEVSRFIKMQSGILADQVGGGKTTTCLALIGMQRNSAGPAIIDYKTGAIVTNATLILVPNGILRQWQAEIDVCFAKNSLTLVCCSTPDQVLRATIENIRQADIVLVSYEILDSDRYWNNVRHTFEANHRPAKSGRGFQHWLADVQQDLDNLIPSFQDDDLSSASKLEAAAKIREQQDRENYARYEPKIRPRDLQLTQGEETEPDHIEATDRNQVGVLKNRLPLLLQMFRWKRLMVDEFNFLEGTALLSALKLKRDHSWMISGTPPVQNFDSVETLAQLVGTKISSHCDEDGIFSFVKNQFKVANDRNYVEEFRANATIRSENFINLRNADAQNFVREHVRQNEAPVATSVDRHIINVQMSAVERLFYVLIVQSLEDNIIPVKKSKKGRESTAENPIIHLEDFLMDHLSAFRNDTVKAKICAQLPVINLLEKLDIPGVDTVKLLQILVQAQDQILANFNVEFECELRSLFEKYELVPVAEQVTPQLVKILSEAAEHGVGCPEILMSLESVPSSEKEKPIPKLISQEINREFSESFKKQLKSYVQHVQLRVLLKHVDECVNDAEMICDACKEPMPDISMGTLMIICGHAICEACSERSILQSGGRAALNDDEDPAVPACCVANCKAPGFGHQKVSIKAFTKEHTLPQSRWGSRIATIVQHLSQIKQAEPPDEISYVLVFVQQKELTKKLLEAFGAAEIQYKDATRRSDVVAEAFKKQPTRQVTDGDEAVTDAEWRKVKQGADRVLVLQLDSVNSAGW